MSPARRSLFTKEAADYLRPFCELFVDTSHSFFHAEQLPERIKEALDRIKEVEPPHFFDQWFNPTGLKKVKEETLTFLVDLTTQSPPLTIYLTMPPLSLMFYFARPLFSYLFPYTCYHILLPPLGK